MRRRILLGVFLAILLGGFLLTAAILSMREGGTEHIGFITGVTTNGNYGILFDEAEWLTGDAAIEAAIAAGVCTEETRRFCLENDYAISNPSTATIPIEFSTDVVITMQTLKMEQEGIKPTVVTRQDFERLINDSRAQWHNLPYRIVVQNNFVVSVDEIYVP